MLTLPSSVDLITPFTSIRLSFARIQMNSSTIGIEIVIAAVGAHTILTVILVGFTVFIEILQGLELKMTPLTLVHDTIMVFYIVSGPMNKGIEAHVAHLFVLNGGFIIHNVPTYIWGQISKT